MSHFFTLPLHAFPFFATAQLAGALKKPKSILKKSIKIKDINSSNFSIYS